MESARWVGAMSNSERNLNWSDMPAERLETVAGFMPGSGNFFCLDRFNWGHFRDRIVSLYFRNGYSVETVQAAGKGLPCVFVLSKGSRRTLLQCQPWHAGLVSLEAVSELYDSQLAARADSSVLLASGIYSPEASNFAQGKPLLLLDGEQCIDLLQELHQVSVATEIPMPCACRIQFAPAFAAGQAGRAPSRPKACRVRQHQRTRYSQN